MITKVELLGSNKSGAAIFLVTNYTFFLIIMKLYMQTIYFSI